MFEKIAKAVHAYNQVSIDAGEPYSNICLLDREQKSTEEEVLVLENRIGIKLPEVLKNLYTGFGSIKNRNWNENNCLDIYSVSYLMERLDDPDKWARTESLGIIDMIRLSWGNDRYELDEELSPAMKAYLNKHYICFGLYRTDDNLESANYLYFDMHGRFGSVFYHQDNFEDLLQNHLRPMLEESPATHTLEELLLEAFEIITELKMEEVSDEPLDNYSGNG
ncbi:SMI1/KNR4 family protein [Dyadobacter flavalbus]|uniref:SMI1/KNR4 family protein n=1 Tax=Dyadobacter flavalbus TaxID=2579942 RepID=A0A5M8QCK9_9BACT|nr:SMI1/KNR4 family protein [Dyadobacter flavalbus]KAA6432763.1 SMI1/KNR4 family protein [Dyadobacter flavalbus]